MPYGTYSKIESGHTMSTVTTQPTVVSQSVTHTAEIREFGPVSLVNIKWGDKRKSNRDTNFLVATKDLIKAARSKKPVDVIMSLSHNYMVLTEEGLTALQKYGKWALYDFGMDHKLRDELGLPDKPNYIIDAQDADALQRLSDLGDRVADLALGGDTDMGIGSVDDPSTPLNFPVWLELSNAYYHIDKLQPVLEKNPLVRHVYYDKGRPGSYDHVPSRLTVIVSLTDQLHKKILALPASASQMGGRFDWALHWAIKYGSPVVGDPLKLTKFVRKEDYNEPRDDWDY
jgi:hypothetical protein